MYALLFNGQPQIWRLWFTYLPLDHPASLLVRISLVGYVKNVIYTMDNLFIFFIYLFFGSFLHGLICCGGFSYKTFWTFLNYNCTHRDIEIAECMDSFFLLFLADQFLGKQIVHSCIFLDQGWAIHFRKRPLEKLLWKTTIS